MRILQLTKKFPYPIKDGEVIGIINLTIGFHYHGHTVDVLSLNTNKHYFDPQKLPESVAHIANFISVDINTDIKVKDAFLNLFSNKSYNVERFYSRKYESQLYKILTETEYDFILLEGIYLMRYINTIRKAQKDSETNRKTPVVQRPQNVEYIIWNRLANSETNILKRLYLRLLAKRIKRFELSMMNKADLFIPVSQTDLDIFKSFGCKIPSIAIPTGYMFNELPETDTSKESNSIGFIGGLDWLPNREGVEWFLNNVWSIVLDKVPNAQFYLAGRNFPDELKKRKDIGLHIVGEVEDAQQFVCSHAISIVPLFAGSGMRVKIVEAMAWSRAIVSTSVGAESIAYTHDKNILIADTAETFAASIVKILKSPEIRLSLGINARKLILEKYDNRVISKAIIDFVKQQS